MDSAFLLGSPFMVKMVIEIDLIPFSLFTITINV